MKRKPDLADILDKPAANGLYRIGAGALPESVVRIDGRALTGKGAMLDEFSVVLAFPDYFGANWDALEECLTDLSWLPDCTGVLIDGAEVPETKAAKEWGTLLDILADTAAFWRDQERPFAVFLHGGHAAYPMVEP